MINKFYDHFKAEVKYVNNSEAGHGHPTQDYGIECSKTGEPYLIDCDYNGAFEALNWLYRGILVPPANTAQVGQVSISLRNYIKRSTFRILYISPGHC